jgi:hypothetical protein
MVDINNKLVNESCHLVKDSMYSVINRDFVYDMFWEFDGDISRELRYWVDLFDQVRDRTSWNYEVS